MKNPRGSAKTTYNRMKSREDKAMKDWTSSSGTPPGRGMPAKKSAKAKYIDYIGMADKRAQAGRALKKSK